MDAFDEPTTVRIALLADIARDRAERGTVHAVLLWTDGGARHHELLVAPVAAPTPPILPGRPEPAAQLRLDLGLAAGVAVSSSGRSWCTYLLDSVPPDLRHLPPADAARALATQLGG